MAFLSVAFSTNSKILFTVLFSYFSVTLTSIKPFSFILPDNTLSFSFVRIFNNIFIDMKNVNRCLTDTTRRQLQYVALSRTAKDAYILQ